MEQRISKTGKKLCFMLCEHCSRWISSRWINRHRSRHIRDKVSQSHKTPEKESV